ncbi:hypothetical protein DPM17_05100 [Polynucleobacter paneuropaeus]|uniref:hypothetical protein n=1 Tax=Polynucleobacter paneuropaeus TaxID=2527775 RepID=UPI000DBF3181|nr:hypothetical protein [Polynucleobacter paneuropaeus]AWW48070.1 hypothetical protein DPM17_05100 [Polynucleobacter paneuropaeus]
MKPFYIDYPQEKIEGHLHAYQCAFCKIPTTEIFGLLVNHGKDCSYRIQAGGFSHSEPKKISQVIEPSLSDELD